MSNFLHADYQAAAQYNLVRWLLHQLQSYTLPTFALVRPWAQKVVFSCDNLDLMVSLVRTGLVSQSFNLQTTATKQQKSI